MIDYYEILNIPSSSDKKGIRKAYYKLARIWHPDKNKDSLALTKFQEISDAYKTLSDETSRTYYDFQLILGEKNDISFSSEFYFSKSEEAAANNTFEYFYNLLNQSEKLQDRHEKNIGKKRRRKRENSENSKM